MKRHLTSREKIVRLYCSVGVVGSRETDGSWISWTFSGMDQAWKSITNGLIASFTSGFDQIKI